MAFSTWPIRALQWRGVSCEGSVTGGVFLVPKSNPCGPSPCTCSPVSGAPVAAPSHVSVPPVTYLPLQVTLYPEAHLVWAPLLPRLTDPAHPVARRAWQVVLCMCEVCGDFLRKRVLEKVFPLLVSRLERMALTSCQGDSLYQ